MDFLCVDLGTSTIKTGVVSDTGELLALVSCESPIIIDGDQVELEADACWDVVVSSIREVLQKKEVSPSNVGGLSITCQGQTFVPLDEHLRPMRRAILWLDQRAKAERDEILKQFDPSVLYEHTGLPHLTPGVMLCVMRWIQKNEPQIYKTACIWVHIADYILYRLTGQIIGERSIYYCSGLYDIEVDGWWEEMLAFIDLSASKLPELYHSAVSFSTLSPEAAIATGLTQRTKVVSGTLDVIASILGAGVVSDDKVLLDLGTTMKTMMTIFERESLLAEHLVWIFGHVIKGANVGVLWRETAGFSLRWFRNNFCQEETRAALKEGLDPYDRILSKVADVLPGADGLLFLPHLLGTRVPASYPNAKGVFWGITPNHTKAHFLRAILEGNAYALRENLEIMKSLGFNCNEIIATGGGTRSQLWNQINADVTGLPLNMLKSSESSLIGAGIVAACGTGCFSSIDEACSTMVKRSHVIVPNPDLASVYEEGYQFSKKVFHANANL